MVVPAGCTPYNSVSPRGPSDHHRPRFRLAVHPAHRASSSRAVGLFRNSAARTRRWQRFAARSPVGIILSGGPKSVSEAGAPHCDPAVFDAGMPVLGICYGMQLMAHALGGEVAPAPQREFGHATITGRSRPARRSVRGRAGRNLRVWASHGDFVAAAPAGFAVIATSANAPVAAMADAGRGALRAAVPSRSRAHRARPRDPPELRLRRLRLHRRLDDGVVCRGGDGADPRAGRRGRVVCGAERRRRLDRRRGASCTARSATG